MEFSFHYCTLLIHFLCLLLFINSCAFLLGHFVSMVLRPFVLLFFHRLQFLSNLAQYSLLYFLSNHPNNFLAMNHPGNSPLLNIPFSFSCFLISSISYWYSFSYSSIASLAFSRFSLPMYLILPWIPSIVPDTCLFLVSSAYSGFSLPSIPLLPQLWLELVASFSAPLPALHIFIFY